MCGGAAAGAAREEPFAHEPRRTSRSRTTSSCASSTKLAWQAEAARAAGPVNKDTFQHGKQTTKHLSKSADGREAEKVATLKATYPCECMEVFWAGLDHDCMDGWYLGLWPHNV